MGSASLGLLDYRSIFTSQDNPAPFNQRHLLPDKPVPTVNYVLS